MRSAHLGGHPHGSQVSGRIVASLITPAAIHCAHGHKTHPPSVMGTLHAGFINHALIRVQSRLLSLHCRPASTGKRRGCVSCLVLSFPFFRPLPIRRGNRRFEVLQGGWQRLVLISQKIVTLRFQSLIGRMATCLLTANSSSDQHSFNPS